MTEKLEDYQPPESRQELLRRYADGERHFPETDLCDADLSGVTLDGASFEKLSWFHSANFEGASLRKTSFRECNVKCADFRRADLTGASFELAAVEAMDLEGAVLEGTSFVGASYYGYTIQEEDQFQLITSLMSGPYHDFLLLSTAEHSFSEYMNFINDPRAIRIEDDLLRYLADTLEWIPTYNPAKDEAHRGLCFWGPTVIHTEGAPAAAAIFDGWAGLLACGPPKLALTGGWTWCDGDAPSEGNYDRLEVDRDEFVAKLRQLAGYARRIVETEGEFFVLHLGV